MTDLEIVELAARRVATRLHHEAAMASTTLQEANQLVSSARILTLFADTLLSATKDTLPK